MLRTIPQSWSYSRLAAIAIFTLLTVVSARLRFEVGPVPITMQTLAVLLAGLVLGSRDGALSQLGYVGLIAMNLPVDTNMLGIAAFAGPTAGYFVSFPLVAYVAGALAERGAERFWLRWGAGLVGVVVLYACGATWLKIWLGESWAAAWTAGVAPFIAVDIAKALAAAALTEYGRSLLRQ